MKEGHLNSGRNVRGFSGAAASVFPWGLADRTDVSETAFTVVLDRNDFENFDSVVLVGFLAFVPASNECPTRIGS